MENHSIDSKEHVIEALFERAKDYVETRGDLYRLKAIKKTSEVGASLISKVIIGVVFTLFLMLLNIALGLWLGELLNKNYLGFFALAGFYLIVGIIIMANKQKILKIPIADSIIKKIND